MQDDHQLTSKRHPVLTYAVQHEPCAAVSATHLIDDAA